MGWYILGSCMCVSGFLIFIWALCRIAAISDRHIEIMRMEEE